MLKHLINVGLGINEILRETVAVMIERTSPISRNVMAHSTEEKPGPSHPATCSDYDGASRKAQEDDLFLESVYKRPKVMLPGQCAGPKREDGDQGHDSRPALGDVTSNQRLKRPASYTATEDRPSKRKQLVQQDGPAFQMSQSPFTCYQPEILWQRALVWLLGQTKNGKLLLDPATLKMDY